MSEELCQFFDGRYAVTKTGEVYSLFYKNRNCFKKRLVPYKLKPRIQNGYAVVNIRYKNSSYLLVHRIIGHVFLGLDLDNRKSFINHKNGIRTDNRVDNLELSDNSENIKHSYYVLGNKSLKKLTSEMQMKMVKEFASGSRLTGLSKKYGISISSISSMFRGYMDKINSYSDKTISMLVIEGYSKNPSKKRAIKARQALSKLKSLGIVKEGEK